MNPKFSRLNAKGYAAVLFSFFLLPVLVMVSFGALRLSQLKDLRWLRENCRQTLIPAQQFAGDSINQLLRLNLIVRALKIEKVAAGVTLAAATAQLNGPAIAAAERWLDSVHLRQKATRAQQQALIRMAEFRLLQAQLSIAQDVQRWKNETRLLYNLELATPFVQRKHLAVRPASRHPYPEYELVRPFSEQQSLVLNWQVAFNGKQTGVKKWIKFDLKFRESCGVTLIEDTQGFQARLSEGRLRWNR